MKNVIFDANILMGTEDFEAMRSNFLTEPTDVAIITLEVLRELDGLKNADGRKGFQARRAIRKIKENYDNFEYQSIANVVLEKLTTDELIIELAKRSSGETIIVTNDIAMEVRARAQKLKVENYFEKKEVGKGHKTVELQVNDSKSILQFLSPLGADLEKGEYLIVNNHRRFVGAYVKIGDSSYERVDEVIFNTDVGAVKAKDPYQLCAMDSLQNNDLTVITGKAGSGKTLLSISKLLDALDKGEIGKIVIFTNPTKARGSEALGFYTGDRNGKLMQNSIGAILSSKLGSVTAVENLIADETLIVMPMSDIRGYEVPHDAALYIPEAQNADADLLQLAVQRVTNGITIVEGDPYSQLDHWSYGGENNGMLKLIEVFKGYKTLPRFEGFAHIHLDKIYRSGIAERASLMTSDDLLGEYND